MKNGSGRKFEALEKLRDVTAILATRSDPGELVVLVLDQAIQLVGAERGFVVLLEGRGTAAEALTFAAARNLDREAVHDPEHKVSRSIVERVARSGEAELIVDAEADEGTRDIPSVRLLKLHSVLCVPLRAHGEALGAVYVDHRYSKGEFDAEDLATLKAFAVPAAIALDAARHREELARGERELRASHDELGRRVETIERLRLEIAERYRERARDANRLRSEAQRLSGSTAGAPDLPFLIARSGAMARVVALLRKAAPSDVPVLILGESGSGKEILARALHALSPRRDQPFLAENCGALAEPLLESELFGHEAGAFTGAERAREGLFEAAGGGTLFLDEVGDMSPGLQVKLLRVLEERAVRRVGGRERIPVNARIVAATHRDLEAMVAAGTFRADTYYRLNVVRVEVPPLRERPDDMTALLDHFLAQATGIQIEPQARELLLSHTWPGNVRELENEVKRLAVLAGPGGTVRPGLLSRSILGPHGASTPSGPVVESGEPPIQGVWRLDDVEKEMLSRALRRAHGNKTLAAKLLGLAKTSLYNRLEKHGLLDGNP